MESHPGEAGYQKQLECNETREFAKDQAEERRKGCIGDSGPRNRRENLRMSDINRAVEKVLPAPANDAVQIPSLITTKEIMASGRFGEIPKIDPELTESLTQHFAAQTFSTDADKNSPESLKTLRWSIYEIIDNYDANYGRTIAGCLKQAVEDLFKQYTNS